MKTTDGGTLPAPKIEDATNTILFLASHLASGTLAGDKYELYQAGATFGLTVTKADGTRISEHMAMKPVLEAWVTAVIERKPDEEDQL